MRLSAEMLDTFDRCERRFAFSQEWESRAISPLALLYRAVESAIQSPDPEQAAKDTTLSIAQSHEIQTDENKFMIVRHVGYLGAIISVALRERFGALRRVESTEEWESALFETESGVRHRIVLISHMDDDVLRSFAHSWGVVGELVSLQAPLTLTAVVVGAHRGGRRHSAWTKGLLHPMNHTLRFARRKGGKGSGFGDSWEEVWREHRGEISLVKWLEGMKSDGVLDSLIVSREIRFNQNDNRLIAAQREMVEISHSMVSASSLAPMRRTSCDEIGRGACPFQAICYSPVETSPEQLVHLYLRK